MCIVSSEDRAQSALRAVAQFANVAGQVQHEELRTASLQVAHEALAQCEAHGQRCVQFLLEALQKSTKASASAAEDVIWMVYKVARRSDTAKAWILQAGGVSVLKAALLCHANQAQLLENGVWTVYALEGLRSLAELLEGCRGTSAEEVAVRGAICGALYHLVSPRRKSTSALAAAEVVQPESVVVLLSEVLSIGGLDEDALWATCTTLETLVDKDARLAFVVASRGGCHILVQLLRSPRAAGPTGQDIRKVLACLMLALADASPEAVQALQAAGACPALAQEGLQGDGADAEAAMWALGAIGGLKDVLQAMRHCGPGKPSVLSGGAHAVAECAARAGDGEELKQLPAALVLLLEMIAQEESAPSGVLKAAMQALGRTLTALTPHAPPGHVAQVDQGVQTLISQLRRPPASVPSEKKEDWWSSQDDGNDGYEYDYESSPSSGAAQAAAEAIGRIALTTAEWRPVLHGYAMEAIVAWIRSGTAGRKFNKYLFWAAAALSGMPFVAAELKLHINCISAVDAALCTVIDILDEDIDGEYTLAGTDRGEAEMPALVALIVEAMRLHPAAPEVQARGATCISFLVPFVEYASLQAVAPAAIVGVLTGSRRFPRRMDVISGAVAALRAFCDLARCKKRPDAKGAEVIVASLRREGAVDCIEQAFGYFSHYEDAMQMLEDAAAVSAQISGVEALLTRLGEEPATSHLRMAGLKAIFEEGRADLDFLSARACAAAVEACERMMLEASQYNESEKEPSDPPIDTQRLHEVASLLSGLCAGRLRAACLA